jgi:exopolysaccharide production protein ExoZ
LETARKIQNIQGLRGIAVLLVIFAHMLTTEAKYAKFDYLLPSFLEIGGSGVDLFFLISGFIMVMVTRNFFQSASEIWRFLYHRFTRIYPMYWLYTFVVLCVWLVFPYMVNSSQSNQINILESIFLVPQNIYPILMVAWTLIYEIYFYLTFAVLLFFPKNKLLLGLSIWIVLLVAGYHFLPSSNPFVNVYFGPLVVEFIAGCLVATLYFDRRLPGNATIIALLALVFWVAGYSLLELDGRGWVRVLVFGFPAMLALYAALLYENKHDMVMPKWLQQIGDASYSIYLSHILVLAIVGRVWTLFAIEGYIDNIIMLMMMFIAVIIVGVLSFRLMEKPILKKARLLEKKLFPARN